MVKLVVADDEERVCRLIVALGNWEELGIKVVGTAANGIQALELIRKEKTDILITDIRMPGLNGLELIEKVREISPDIKIMIISGYANFEYAQNALKGMEALVKGGTQVLVGYSASGDMKLPTSLICDKEITIKSVFRYRHIYPLAIQAVAEGKVNLKGIVTNIFELDDIQNAMDRSVNEKADIVKSVVKIC